MKREYKMRLFYSRSPYSPNICSENVVLHFRQRNFKRRWISVARLDTVIDVVVWADTSYDALSCCIKLQRILNALFSTKNHGRKFRAMYVLAEDCQGAFLCWKFVAVVEFTGKLSPCNPMSWSNLKGLSWLDPQPCLNSGNFAHFDRRCCSCSVGFCTWVLNLCLQDQT